jgi:hypothetical protein
MITLQYPELLFEKTKVYKITHSSNAAEPKEFHVKNPQILLVFEESEVPISEPVQQMFSKLVAACGFSDNEKLLINYAEQLITLSDIQNKLQPKLVLLFGDLKLGGNIAMLKANNPTRLGENVFIKTEQPQKLVTNNAGKTALWKAIKHALTLIK